MSESSIAIICSSVVSIISVCIPLFTAFINNEHTKKMKELELYQENKINAYKEFFSEFGKLRSVPSYANLQALGEKVSKAILFSTPEIREKLQVILEYCANVESKLAIQVKEIDKAYIAVVPLISEDLNKTIKFSNNTHKLSKSKDSKEHIDKNQ